jgi:serine/threonine protein kinase/Tol biopolymer transport system component
MLSRYSQFTRLGQGGMGIVYKATDTQLHRPVALKFVTGQFGSEEQARARFLREARMAAGLNHPAICTIYEVGEVQPGEERSLGPELTLAPGTPFIAMELIEGKALDAVLRERGRFAPSELLEIAIPIAEALAAAHAKGIVHRDLKPANVMMTLDGRPKVLDFGLAKLVESSGDVAETAAETESGDLTRRGQVLGTVAYMSPEQAQGKPVDSRSDIFSFGVMLYELAAGERPFRGDTPTSTLAKILETEPKPLGDIRGDLPGELLRIVRRCLRKKPEERFQGTNDLVVALKELKQETASGPTQGWSDAVSTAALRRRRAVLIAGSVLIVAAAIAGGAMRLARQSPKSQPESTQRQITSNPSESAVLDAAISPDGRYLAYADPTGTYLREIDAGETHQLLTHETLAVVRLAWFPDGSRLAATAAGERAGGFTAWSISVLGGAPRKLRDNAWIGGVSPDGSLISFMDFLLTDKGVAIYGIGIMGPSGENARLVVPLAKECGLSSPGNWSPDGRKFLFVRAGAVRGFQGTLEAWDRIDNRTSVILSEPKLALPGRSSAIWLPDGRIVYALIESSPMWLEASVNLWIAQVNPSATATIGEPRRLTSYAGWDAYSFSASRDGKRLAFLRQHRQPDVYVGELRADNTRLEDVQRLTVDERTDSPSGWTRDSKAIYFASTRQGTLDVFKQGVHDRAAAAVVEGPDGEENAQLSPDGSYLLYMVHPAARAAPNRIMRVPVSGGPPETVQQQTDSFGFGCPRALGATCVAAERVGDKVALFAMDPVKGMGRKIGEANSPYANWSVSPDGSRIALTEGDPNAAELTMNLRIMTIADGVKTDLHPAGLVFPESVTWSADGKGLFVTDMSSASHRLSYVDLNGHMTVIHTSASRDWWIFGCLASPDGRYLAFEEFTPESNAWLLENF